MKKNLLLLTDSYKITHWKQYPPGTEQVYSYFESRGGRFAATLFFGLQYLLKEYLVGPVVTQEKIEEASEFCEKHFGEKNLFNRAGWQYILNKHKGYLPIHIKAVPEGSIVPLHNVLITSENTDPKCYWLTNYLETLLVEVWYPTTVATLSYEIKKMIIRYLEATGNPDLYAFKLHDFGFRGVSSVESAGIGGLAHLINFKGTDTMQALMVGREYYNEEMPGFSIPAAEHSTITAWGEDNEVKAYENMLIQYPDSMLISVVSDSYDIYKACRDYWGTQLKDQVLNLKGTLVVRPDSGYQPEVVVKVLDILGEKFGSEKNKKGFKILHPKVRVIQAGGLDYDITDKILDNMKKNGWSADNITFGMGGGLLQKLHRDTQEFAFKCSSITINGKEQDVFKEPVTDVEKKSKPGKLKLICTDRGVETVRIQDFNEKDCLIDVFENGKLLIDWKLSEIRERAIKKHS